MKALILTYDKNRAITNFMIHMYRKHWPDHPFTFYIPYQNLNHTEFEQVSFVHTDPGIKSTILSLLDKADPEEWIYWCIDDKFPMHLDVNNLKKMLDLLKSEDFKHESGLMFCHKNGTLYSSSRSHEKITRINGFPFQRRKTLKPFWIHQFMKAKVIREIVSQFPDEISYAKIMDEFLRDIQLPDDFRLWVTKDNLAVFGESSIGGKLTSTFVSFVKQEGLPIPALPVTNAGGNIYGKKQGKLTTLKKSLKKIVDRFR